MLRKEKDFDRLILEAEARDKIRGTRAKKKSNGILFVVAILAGMAVSLLEGMGVGGFSKVVAWGIFAIAFGFFTGFISFPKSYEDEMFMNDAKRSLNLWSQFEREGRTNELILVLVVPFMGRLFAYFL